MPASEVFVENIVDAVPGGRTLLLVDFRPEYHAAWMQKSWYHQLPLLFGGSEGDGGTEPRAIHPLF